MLSSVAAALPWEFELVFCMAKKERMLRISLWKLLSARLLPLEARRHAAIHRAYCSSYRPKTQRWFWLTDTLVQTLRDWDTFGVDGLLSHFHSGDRLRSSPQDQVSAAWWGISELPCWHLAPLHSLCVKWWSILQLDSHSFRAVLCHQCGSRNVNSN